MAARKNKEKDDSVIIVAEHHMEEGAYDIIMNILQRQTPWRQYRISDTCPAFTAGTLSNEILNAIKLENTKRIASLRESLSFFLPVRSDAEFVIASLDHEPELTPQATRLEWKKILETQGEHFFLMPPTRQEKLVDELSRAAATLRGAFYDFTSFIDAMLPEENMCETRFFMERAGSRPELQWYAKII